MTFVKLAKSLLMATLLAAMPQAVMAQQAEPQAATVPAGAPEVAEGITPIEQAADPNEVEAGATEAPTAEGSYTPMKPTQGKGMPVDAGYDFQDQYSETGEDAYWMNTYVLNPVIIIISLFVLLLLVIVMVRFRAKANPVPSKTTHNSLIEVLWTLIPVLILLGIAVPSISLLAKQYESAPEDALTVKVTGNEWYWSYSYPDNGGFEIISNMLSKEDAIARGEPELLAVDNRMVVPAGVPIRLIVTANATGVIHSFAVPSLWFKLDAVPGRLNEKKLFIKEPGVYYGQCSELCGARHAYMPIAIEALPMPQYIEWVRAQGGSPKAELEAAAKAEAAAAAEAKTEDAPGTATETPAEEAETVNTDDVATGTRPATPKAN